MIENIDILQYRKYSDSNNHSNENSWWLLYVVAYYQFTDNLGSYLSLMDADGNKVFDASYDAWGNPTITTNEIGFYRGYTGHEHLRYAISSFIDAAEKSDHKVHATEQDANIRAFKYFMKHVPDYGPQKRRGNDIVGWDFIANPIVGYNRYLPYSDERNQSVLKKGMLSLGWADYLLGPNVLGSGIINSLTLKQ